MLVMVRTPFLQNLVSRGDAGLLLRFLLEKALGVAKKFFGENFIQMREHVFFNENLGDLIAAVKIQSADQRLKSVGQNELARSPQILRFAPGKQEI